MPLRKKDTGKKLQPKTSVHPHPHLSNLSLVVVPKDAVEGYQGRIDTGIEFTFLEETARQHKKDCQETDIPICTFSEALERKLKKTILGGFIDDNSKLSPLDYLETMVNTELWEQEKVTDVKQRICFLSNNFITNDLEKLMTKAVRIGNRKSVREELKNVSVLRLNNAKMTDLDSKLIEYKKLEHLVLSGNLIRNLNGEYLPPHIKMLELQANGISDIKSFTTFIPECFYLGLARNLLPDESVSALSSLSYSITVLDLEDNDIKCLASVLDALVILPCLLSLTLAGNPCSLCAGYAVVTFRTLTNLKWLDNRKVLKTDISPPLLPKQQPTEIHPDDLRSSWFFFKVLRIMSTPPPPKPEKGSVGTFHVELEIPLLDSKRRHFLMYRENEFLTEYPPLAEDELLEIPTKPTTEEPSVQGESNGTDLYRLLEPKDNKCILNYKVFESNKVPWNNMMTFQDPTVQIFCPDLVALRNTFRSVITVRFVYTLSLTAKTPKAKRLSIQPISEYRVVLATVKCALKHPDWSQKAQHFHWDTSMDTDTAMHWGDGDLEILHYAMPTKTQRSQKDFEQYPRQPLPKYMTCHFSFGIETLA